ncbi:amidohydrolase [Streptomyces sp. NPDC127092]|uniref:amidohydrolase n=1 Tax=Streptomyces sp. NPDC127092 TaxID=3347135 RepID=UPI003665CBE9
MEGTPVSTSVDVANRVLGPLATQMSALEAFYEDLHRHPELGFLETRTAANVAKQLGTDGFEVLTGVGRTGVVGVLRNGDGPVVLLRADMDALPVKEQTGLPYASTDTQTGLDGKTVPVAHACGHDVHVTCLLGAARLLAAASDAWAGTLIALFQPNEEEGGGADGMIADGLYDQVPTPDVVLAQHVIPGLAGTVYFHPGAAMAAADRYAVTFHGHGAHGSSPHTGIDPVLMAAAAVQRWQGIVAREIAPGTEAVVTVGSIHGGDVPNAVPDRVVVKLDLRSYDQDIRTKLIDAVARIARAEATASGADQEPDIEVLNTFPVLVNDDQVATEVNQAFAAFFGSDRLAEAPAASGSEDAGVLAAAAGAPLYYWWIGGDDPAVLKQYQDKGEPVPSNHSPFFGPVKQPTLTVGVQALVVAALNRFDQAHLGP